MRVSHVIFSVLVCLFTVPGHQAPKIPGADGLKAKWQQWKDKRGNGGGNGDGYQSAGGLKASAMKVANGVMAKIPGGGGDIKESAMRAANGVRARIPGSRGGTSELSVLQSGPVQRLSEASNWLNFDVGQEGVDGEQYQELEFALVQYLQEENPFRFQVKLQNFYDAKEKVPKVDYSQDVPDVRERGNLKLPQDYQTDPREDPKHVKDCCTRCIYLFGYVMKTIKPNGRIKGALRAARLKWGTTPTEGALMPLTKAKIIFDSWSGLKSKLLKLSDKKTEFSSFVCTCETRDEIYQLLSESQVQDLVGFQKIKSESARRLLVYLEKIFKGTDLQLVPHNLFMQTMIEAMVNNGRGPKQNVEAPQVARDAEAWETQRFRRLPTIAYNAQQQEEGTQRSPSKNGASQAAMNERPAPPIEQNNRRGKKGY